MPLNLSCLTSNDKDKGPFPVLVILIYLPLRLPRTILPKLHTQLAAITLFYISSSTFTKLLTSPLGFLLEALI